MNPTHDWHIHDGMELVIRRDEEDTVGVHLGHENMDDAHATTILTSRLIEMIDTVQPGAIRAYLSAQEPTDAERAVRELHHEREWRQFDGTFIGGTVCNACRRPYPCPTIRVLDAARVVRRDEEKR